TRLEFRRVLFRSSAIPQQIRDAGTSMGQRMNTIVEVAIDETTALRHYRAAVEAHQCHGHASVVFGLAAAAVGVSVRQAVAAYLMQLATALTQNAIRSIPLGQYAGQLVLTDLLDVLTQVVDFVF